MGLRELLILILILAIVVVVLRGLYVALRSRRGQIKIALEKNIPEYDLEELEMRELPNGGARQVERSFAEVLRQNSAHAARANATATGKPSTLRPGAKGLKTNLSRTGARTATTAATVAANQARATASADEAVKTAPVPESAAARDAQSAPELDFAPTDEPMLINEGLDAEQGVTEQPRHEDRDDPAEYEPALSEQQPDPVDEEPMFDDEPLMNVGDGNFDDDVLSEPAENTKLEDEFPDETPEVQEPVFSFVAQRDDDDIDAFASDYADDDANDNKTNDGDSSDEAWADDDDDTDVFGEKIQRSVEDDAASEDDADADGDVDVEAEAGAAKTQAELDNVLDELLQSTTPVQPLRPTVVHTEEFSEPALTWDAMAEVDDEAQPKPEIEPEPAPEPEYEPVPEPEPEPEIEPEPEPEPEIEPDYEPEPEIDPVYEPEPEIEPEPKPEFASEPEPEAEAEAEAELEPESESEVAYQADPLLDYAADGMDDEGQQQVMQETQETQETQEMHHDSQSDPLPVEDDMPDFDNEYIADPEPQPEEDDSFAASRDDDMDVLFDDDDRERRIAALEEQTQDSAPKRFMSWVGGAFGRGASASKAQAAEQAEVRQEAQDKIAKAEKKARKKLAKAEKKQAQRELQEIEAAQRQSDPGSEDLADDYSDDDGILSVRETERPGAAERARAEQLRQSQLDLGDDTVDEDVAYAQEEDRRPPEPPEYSEVLVINVLARPGTELAGDDLLPVLMSNGLKFGEMSIFHRHTDKIGGRKNGPVMFSVANALNPGTFDLNRISEFSTLGVCFFMTLPNVVNNMMAFEQMLATARKVQVALDAELKDDNRSVMTAQTVEHYRQRIRDFELQQLKNAHVR